MGLISHSGDIEAGLEAVVSAMLPPCHRETKLLLMGQCIVHAATPWEAIGIWPTEFEWQALTSVMS